MPPSIEVKFSSSAKLESDVVKISRSPPMKVRLSKPIRLFRKKPLIIATPPETDVKLSSPVRLFK